MSNKRPKRTLRRIELLESRSLLAAQPVISEIVARNAETFTDEDGDSSDWLELTNTGDESVDLNGWSLTDNASDLGKWQLPSRTLEPGDTLLVFASGKNRGPLAGELHTNFRLDGDGEYLALVSPDLAVAHEFSPEFPPQLEDISYGVPMSHPIIAPISLAENQPTAQLVSHFTFDDPENLGDDTGMFNNDGVAVGNAQFTTEARTGSGALLLDGERSFIRLDDTGLDYTSLDDDGDGFTLAAWIKIDEGDTGNRRIFSLDMEEGFFQSRGWAAGLRRSNSLYATSYGRDDFEDPGEGELEPGEWRHVAYVFEPDAGTVEFFIDGQSTGIQSTDNEGVNDALETDNFLIGGVNFVSFLPGQFFAGSIDDLRIYDGPLTEPQLFALQSQVATSASVVRYTLPQDGSSDGIWHETGFDSREWTEAVGSIGYETAAGAFAPLIRETVPSGTTSAYLRYEFSVDDPDLVDRLLLRLRYDDGFVAYLNGTHIASDNVPINVAWDSTALTDRSPGLASQLAAFDISSNSDLLTTGNNVLAIHALNDSAASADFLIAADLLAVGANSPRFLIETTPGRLNTSGNNFGPLIEGVQHFPASPTELDDILITAQVTPLASAVDAVTVNYRTMYEAEQQQSMNDLGIAGDVVAGDGIYTATLPAGVAATGEMLRYSVTTLDQDGGSFKLPFLPTPTEPSGFPEYFGTVVQKPVDTPLPVFQWFVENPTWHLRNPNNPSGGNNRDWTFASVFFDGEFYDNIQVRVRGTPTVQNWRKPKFKFEFNDSHEFRFSDHEGRVDEFNLQSHHVEVLPGAGLGSTAVSYMRETLAYEFLREIGVPASTAFHMHIRQNGDFYSLASFVEQVDRAFLRRNGFDDEGAMYKASPTIQSTLAPNPNPGIYRKVNRKDENFDDLVEFTDGINGLIPAVTAEAYLFDNVNLPEVINDMAGQSIIMNHDRLTKNYYVYRDTLGNQEWSRFPWDVEQAFSAPVWNHFVSVLYGDSEHSQGTGNETQFQNHLLDAILDTPNTRAMFLQRLRTLIDTYLGDGPGYFEDRVDEYHDLIAADAALDHAKWGSGPIQAGVDSIKANLATRRSQLASDPILNGVGPGIANLRFGTVNDDPTESLDEIVFNPISGNQDEEYIAIINDGTGAADISGWRLTGGVELVFQPGTVIPANSTMYVSPDVSAFRARQTGPSGGQSLFVQGNYSGRLSNFGESVQLLNASLATVDSFLTPVAPTSQQLFLRVSELHYNPAGNDATEFIEVLNISPDTAVSLTGVTISDGPSEPYTFSAGSELKPGERRLVVKDLTAFSAAYPAVDTTIIDGVFVGSFANGGERVKLDDSNGSTIVEFEYGDGRLWPNAADGVGASLELVAEGIPRGQIGDFASWRSSREFGGSPGTEGMGPLGVVINEIRTNTNDMLFDSDAIELFNVSEVAIDIGGWYLSDSGTTLKKFAIPSGTVIGPHEYIVFDESDFNPTPNSPAENHFALDGAGGDDVWLVTFDAAGQLKFLIDDVHFDALQPSQTLGRLPNGQGRLSPLGRDSLGCHNSQFLGGPVIISEVAYDQQPTADQVELYADFESNDLEYIELHNASMRTVELTNWVINGGVSGEFAVGTTLLPNEVALIISFDPDSPANINRLTAFRLRHGDVRIIGQFRGQLSNSGDLIQLFRPDTPPAGAPDQVPLVLADEVLYDNQSAWPDAADSAIHRAAPTFLGTDGVSWVRGESPGSVPYDTSRAGDITGDDEISSADLDSLLDHARNDTRIAYLDQNSDRSVDDSDVESLLASVWSTVLGDANLDGRVDAQDLNQVGIHWQSGCTSWSDGNFDGDRIVDAADLNVLGINWQHGVSANASRPPRAPLSLRLAADRTGATAKDTKRGQDASSLSTDKVAGHPGLDVRVMQYAGSRSHRPVGVDAVHRPAAIHTDSMAIVDKLLAKWPGIKSGDFD